VSHSEVYIHPTADVSDKATIGSGTKIWHEAQVREEAVIGKDCILGKGSYVDKGVRIGDFCKLQNGVFVFHGFDLDVGVFLGPGVMLLNDRHPRAINPDGTLKSDADWEVSQGLIGYGAAVGGGAVILPGLKVGRMALVGAGAVVTRDVPERGIVAGNPARLRGFACDCGHTLTRQSASHSHATWLCKRDGKSFDIPLDVDSRVGVEALA
jgi:UDP-2-acetamido-3-amino-2,3-dideoxy-glucuronate N-acetyltransferase